MELLECPIRPYAWGSRDAIARLQGRPAPTPGPEAELWVGAHESAPSLLPGGGSLAERIATDPGRELGPESIERFGPVLPFLLKVVAAASPLSLQAHPGRALARAGFDAEAARGLPLDDPGRNYRDPRPKPELVVALTPFSGLCGFRDPTAAAAAFDRLGVDALAPYAERLRAAGAAALPGVIGELLCWPAYDRPALVAAVGAAAERLAAAGDADAGVLAGLAGAFPADPGVVCAALLNVVRLAPGEGLFLPPGNLHAYLGGTAVEVMANSDNVVRGGLTAKRVDVDELLRVVECTPCPASPVRATGDGPERIYAVPAEEFRLSRIELAGTAVQLDRRGPQLLLCVEGEVGAAAGGHEVVIGQGHAAYVAADEPAPILRGSGTVFRATAGG